MAGRYHRSAQNTGTEPVRTPSRQRRPASASVGGSTDRPNHERPRGSRVDPLSADTSTKSTAPETDNAVQEFPGESFIRHFGARWDCGASAFFGHQITMPCSPSATRRARPRRSPSSSAAGERSVKLDQLRDRHTPLVDERPTWPPRRSARASPRRIARSGTPERSGDADKKNMSPTLTPLHRCAWTRLG